MAEKAVLLDKLPPTQAAQASAPTPQITPTPTPPQGTEIAATELQAHTVQADLPEMTATAFEKLTYYSFVLDMLVFGMAGIYFLVKAQKNRSAVRYGPMAGYGVFLLALSLSYFFLKGSYAQALWDSDIIPTLAPRAFFWTLLAPALFYLLSQLIRIQPSERNLYIALLAAASGIFFFIGISQTEGLSRLTALGISIFPLLCSSAVCILLVFTLGALPDTLHSKVRQGLTIVVFVIAGGWVLYPMLNLLSHLLPNPPLYLFLLNLTDLALMSGITYGIYESVATVSERIAIKPAFQMAAPPAPDPEPAPVPMDENPELGENTSRKIKPKFRPPTTAGR